jgi:hypothetical protein
MDIEAFLLQRAGVARTSTLCKAGFSRTRLDKALAAQRIVRIRRGIYSLPEEAGVLGLALRHNALLTCVSAAPTYRLWRLHEAGPVHLSPGHKRNPPGTLAHGRLLHPVHPWLPVAGLADVLIHALRCLPEVEEPRQVKKDRKRNNATVIGGRLVLRFGYDDVVNHPERMVAEVLAVLEQCRRGAFGAS